jgi:hypothetical protein
MTVAQSLRMCKNQQPQTMHDQPSAACVCCCLPQVSHLRGLLSDLEKRNKIAVQHAVGGLDSKARVPWRPVGWGSQVSE